MQPRRARERSSRKARLLQQQRRRRDERLLAQELTQRAERDALPCDDDVPLPRID